MDQIKIGRFISQMRKEQNLTQRQLADKLSISDKTVSKWETGKGLPEVSLMLPLCKELNINVNELLSGEKLSDEQYKPKAEENIMRLINEKEENRNKMIISGIIAFITVLAVVALTVIIQLEPQISVLTRIILIIVAVLIMVSGIGAACVLDRGAGYFECPKCGNYFIPDMTSYIMAPHTVTRRKLRCPECGKKSYCLKRLSHK